MIIWKIFLNKNNSGQLPWFLCLQLRQTEKHTICENDYFWGIDSQVFPLGVHPGSITLTQTCHLCTYILKTPSGLQEKWLPLFCVVVLREKQRWYVNVMTYIHFCKVDQLKIMSQKQFLSFVVLSFSKVGNIFLTSKKNYRHLLFAKQSKIK